MDTKEQPFRGGLKTKFGGEPGEFPQRGVGFSINALPRITGP